MAKITDYQQLDKSSVYSIVQTIDQDVEHGEDILMLGYGLVLMAPLFAPLLPPHILLPAMAACFVGSVCWARQNFYRIQRYTYPLSQELHSHQLNKLKPVLEVLEQHPRYTLSEGFNPVKNLLRTLKSILGSMLINPLWMPIFYMLGLQFSEEKHLQLLNKAVLEVEQQFSPFHRRTHS